MWAVRGVPGPHQLVEGAVKGYGLSGGGTAGVMRLGGFGGDAEVQTRMGRRRVCGGWRRAVRRVGDTIGGQGSEKEEDEDEKCKGGDAERFPCPECLVTCIGFGQEGFLVLDDDADDLFVSQSPTRQYVEHVVDGKDWGDKEEWDGFLE